eukprot:6178488-Pleurochrysis_carterae.AAC.4
MFCVRVAWLERFLEMNPSGKLYIQTNVGYWGDISHRHLVAAGSNAKNDGTASFAQVTLEFDPEPMLTFIPHLADDDVKRSTVFIAKSCPLVCGCTGLVLEVMVALLPHVARLRWAAVKCACKCPLSHTRPGGYSTTPLQFLADSTNARVN